jgi:hypothetical protein
MVEVLVTEVLSKARVDQAQDRAVQVELKRNFLVE